jgi:hypothetical protein
MAFRFRKSVKLAPGVRMNFSGSGVSWTAGPRGASVGIGKRGAYLNTGIPGTGLYARQSLASGTPQRAAPPRPKVNVELTVRVEDDGTVTFQDMDGQPVSDDLISQAKKQQGDAIKALIHRACAGVNSQVSDLGELHLNTPSPNTPPTYRAGSFDVPIPRPSEPKVPGFIQRLFKSTRTKIEQENAHADLRYRRDRLKWDEQKARFEAAEKHKQVLVGAAVAGDVLAMEEFFGEVLQDIVWPRETAVSYEVRDGGTRLIFDVDLPEVEDMPTQTATVPQRGYKLSLKALSQTAVQKLYAQHIHSIAFRLLGEAFGMLPTIRVVTLSGYSQRKDKATGHEQDDYLLSVTVPRTEWETLNFNALPDLDVVEALERLGVRREMSKAGVFKAIEPL